MKTDIDYLPPQKQRELERVVQLIFEEFEDAFALAKHDWKKAGRILKVILYGSYARGTWVDEPHTAKGYQVVNSHWKLLASQSTRAGTKRQLLICTKRLRHSTTVYSWSARSTRLTSTTSVFCALRPSASTRALLTSGRANRSATGHASRSSRKPM